MKKKLAAIILAMVVMLTPMAQAANFSDTKGHWAESTIDNMVDFGIINGYKDGTFRPNNNMTRAEFVVMYYRFMYPLADEIHDPYDIGFYDVDNDAWYADAAWHMNGYQLYDQVVLYEGVQPAYMFYPNKLITRGEVALVIGSILVQLDGDYPTMYDNGQLRKLTHNTKIMIGDKNGNLRFDDTITRAEIATVTKRLVDYIMK